MSQSVVISSNEFNGEIANILFNPLNSDDVINLGQVTLPVTFNPSLLTPPRTIYGFYTITIIESICTYYLKIPIPPQTLIDPIITNNDEYISVGEGFYLMFDETEELINPIIVGENTYLDIGFNEYLNYVDSN
jgi:hypothetical protein